MATFKSRRRKFTRKLRSTTRLRRTGRKSRQTLVKLTKSVSAFPSSVLTRLRYFAHFDLAPGVALARQVFNCNSVFDPDFTNAGHQPMGRDQWAAIYARYRVVAMNYRIIAVNNSLDSGVITTVVPLNSSTSITNAIELAEQPRAITKVAVYRGNASIFKGKVNCRKITGVTKTEYMGDDRFQAAVGASPAENICLHIMSSIPSGGNVTVTYTCYLSYVVQFFDPFELTTS